MPAVGSGTSITVTLTAAVPANAKIIVNAGWFGATTVSSVTDNSGLGNTYAANDGTTTNGSDKMSESYCDSGASGLPINSVVTVNFSAASTSRYATVSYIANAAAGPPALRSANTTGTTAWTSGALASTTTQTETGGCYAESGGATSTVSGGNNELTDQAIAGDSSMTTVYQQGTGGSIAAQGTWTANTANAAFAQMWDASGPPPQTVLPDADTTTTGWSATPLFSKVNDSSDATVITSTLA